MLAVLLPFLAAVTGQAAPTARPAADPLAGMAFLVGHWAAGEGKVAETGGKSTGRSTFTREAGGRVLLRRDHTDLFDAAGKPAGGFDQIMLIYPEENAVHADYSDGTHVIHYTRAVVEPDRSVTFISDGQAGSPVFRLRYTYAAPVLTVDFAMSPDGSHFRAIATGTLTRAARP